MARVNIRLNMGGRTTSTQVPAGQFIGAAIIFATSSPIHSLEQIGKIYYEDQPHRTINPRYQIREGQDEGKTFVVEASPFPVQCVPEGLGFYNGEVGIPQEFFIRTNRESGGGWPTDIHIQGPSAEVSATLQEENGLYKVAFTPEQEGEHVVTVTFAVTAKVHIPVGNMVADAIQCIAYGPGLERGEQYKPAQFTIEARNKLGNKIPVGGHNFKVKVTDPFGNDVPAELVDNGDGTYGVTYTPFMPGDHVVDVKLGDLPIKDSPFRVPIDYSSETAHAGNSYAEGPGLEDNVNSNRMKTPATFTIHAVDRDGNHKTTGGDDFDVFIEDPLYDIIPAEVKDNSDGTYTVEYWPKEPGVHHVDIVLRNKVFPLDYEHIKNSPANVKIKSGTSPENCIAEGPGLKDGIKDTFPAEFKIYARDRDNNPIKEGGDEFIVKIVDPDGREVPTDVKDNGDGTYDVQYHPERDGPHKVLVTLDDTPIKDMPKTVHIKPGAFAGTSFIEGFSFVVHSRDKRGNDIKEGGQNIKTSIKDAGGHPIELRQTDRKDGKYLVEYSLEPELRGLAEICVTVDDQHVKGSPFFVGRQ